MSAAEGINCHEKGCLCPYIAQLRCQTHTALVPPHSDLHWGGGISLVSICYIFSTYNVKKPDRAVKNRANSLEKHLVLCPFSISGFLIRPSESHADQGPVVIVPGTAAAWQNAASDFGGRESFHRHSSCLDALLLPWELSDQPQEQSEIFNSLYSYSAWVF